MDNERMRLQMLELAPLGACCYILSAPDAKACAVIDPGGEAERVIKLIRGAGQTLEMVLLTHSHYDHIGGVEDLLSAFPDAKLGCHPECGKRIVDPRLNLSVPVIGHAVRLPAPDQTFGDEESFKVAGLSIMAMFLPGHSPGHLAYYVPKAESLFTGDVLFAGGIGRSDLPGSDPQTLMESLSHLLDLPPETRIYPGHGPESTIGREAASNPFLVDHDA